MCYHVLKDSNQVNALSCENCGEKRHLHFIGFEKRNYGSLFENGLQLHLCQDCLNENKFLEYAMNEKPQFVNFTYIYESEEKLLSYIHGMKNKDNVLNRIENIHEEYYNMMNYYQAVANKREMSYSFISKENYEKMYTDFTY